jgi:hypothetical protein
MTNENPRLNVFDHSQKISNAKGSHPQLKRKSQLVSEDLHAEEMQSQVVHREGVNHGHSRIGNHASTLNLDRATPLTEESAAGLAVGPSRADSTLPFQPDMASVVTNVAAYQASQQHQEHIPGPTLSSDSAVLQLHPGADWMRAQQRISDLRVAVEASKIFNVDMQNQVIHSICLIVDYHTIHN